MTTQQQQAMKELIDIIDANLSYRIGNFEFDHSQRTGTQNGTIYLNCVARDGKTPTCRFKVETINDRGYNLISNGDINFDWGARLVLEENFDPEGNPINAIIEDNSGCKVVCSVLYEGTLAITGYAHTSGTKPYTKYTDTLLTVGNLCYLISVNRADFFFHFVDKVVEIHLNQNSITLKTTDPLDATIVEQRTTNAILIKVVDSIESTNNKMAEAKARRLAKTSALLQ